MPDSSTSRPESSYQAPVTQASGEPFTETREFGVWTVLAALAAGAVVGAGAATLLAPDSGRKTRRRMAKQVRRLTGRERRTWKRLRRALDNALEERRVQRRAERIAEERTAEADE